MITRRTDRIGFIAVLTISASIGLIQTANAENNHLDHTVDANGVHVTGFDVYGSKVIYDNDWTQDVPDDEYIYAHASLGNLELVGVIATRDMWPGDGQSYTYSLQSSIDQLTWGINNARAAGMANIPDVTAGADGILVKPGSGQIDDTVAVPSDGSNLIVQQANLCTPAKPLLIFAGGNFTTIANAALQDPTITDKIIVFGLSGGYNVKDAWACYVTGKRCKMMMWGNGYYFSANSVFDRYRFDALPGDNPGEPGYEVKQELIRYIESSLGQANQLGDGSNTVWAFDNSVYLQARMLYLTGEPLNSTTVTDPQDPWDVLDIWPKDTANDWDQMQETFFATMENPSIYDPQPPTPPDAPTDLAATAVSDAQINLSWTDNADNEDGFRIERKTTGNYAPLVTVGANVTSHMDTGLTYMTTYTYRILAYNTTGDSTWSNEASDQTLEPAPPAAPINLLAVPDEDRVTLTWDANTETDPYVIYYKIHRSTTQGGPYTTVAVAFGGNNIIDFSVTSGTTYYYVITAVDIWPHESGYSSEVHASPHVPNPPDAPNALVATAVSATQIHLNWTDNADNEDGFRIIRNSAELDTVGENITSYDDTGLLPGTTYNYKVMAYNIDGNSPEPNPTDSATTEPQPGPNAPGNLAAIALSSSRIDLSWTDNADNEDGFQIDRKVSSGSYTQLDTVSADVTSYSDTSLTAGTSYTYRVLAYNTGGESAYSNEDSAVTAAGSVLREYWTGISGGEVSHLTGHADYPDNPTGSTQPTSFEAPTDWADNYGTRIRGYLHIPVTGSYEFWIASDDDSELWFNSSGPGESGAAIIASVDGWTSSREWTKYSSQHSSSFTLQAGQTYYMEALHKEGSGGDNLAVAWQGPGITRQVIPGSQLSPWVDAPPTEPPAAPTSLTATAVNSSLINLGWTDNADNEAGFRIERKTGAGAFAEIGTAGADAESYNDSGLLPETTYTYRVRAYNIIGNSAYTNEASDTTPAYSGEWLEAHIGGCDPLGTYTDNAGVWTITGIGEAIVPSDATDQTYFIYKEVTGDIEIVCRNVNNGSGTAGRQCGVCIRDSLDTGAKQISVMHSNGMNWLYGSYRSTTDGNNTWVDPGKNTNPNYWLKVSRTGDTCRMYYSTNGSTWTQFRSETISFTGTVCVGVFASSESATTTISSDFVYDNIATTP